MKKVIWCSSTTTAIDDDLKILRYFLIYSDLRIKSRSEILRKMIDEVLKKKARELVQKEMAKCDYYPPGFKASDYVSFTYKKSSWDKIKIWDKKNLWDKISHWYSKHHSDIDYLAQSSQNTNNQSGNRVVNYLRNVRNWRRKGTQDLYTDLYGIMEKYFDIEVIK